MSYRKSASRTGVAAALNRPLSNDCTMASRWRPSYFTLPNKTHPVYNNTSLAPLNIYQNAGTSTLNPGFTL